MHKRPLGTSSIKITPIVLGTWAIGGWMWGGTDEKDAIAAIQTSIDQGVTTIDTAAVYGMGLSETIVGKAIQGRRDEVVIATKCGLRWSDSDDTLRRTSKPDSIAFECEQSLKRLGIDTIDLYQIHWPDTSTPIEDAWGAMVHLLEQGKVRAIGVSNFDAHQLSKAHAIYPVHSIQSPYSLMRRGHEEDIVPFCQNNNIAILAYSPLERGLLTGKIDAHYRFAKGDHRSENPTFSPANRARALAILENIRPIADRHHATLAQIILHCTYHMPGITAALAGARNAAQALENARAAALHLTQDERLSIVAAFA
jgi:aryl-alcohol dehydrogenase-like predicted oxidoreductase